MEMGDDLTTGARKKGSIPQELGLNRTLAMLLRYKAWADEFTFDHVGKIPAEEALRQRQTTFGSIIQTLNHVYVVDDIFRHHLQGRNHGYEARVTEEVPALADLWKAVRAMDDWYIATFESWSDEDLGETVAFEFVGGGEGLMTRAEIGLHIVNHTTYHRGFIGDMMRQVPYIWPANDLTVFLRSPSAIADLPKARANA